MASPQTKPGTARLSEVARHLVVPAGIVSTGWPAVRDKCRDLGVEFDQWQDGAGRLILSKRADGKLAAMVGGIGMSLPRQVGKTYLLAGLLFALAILRPGLLVIWTAHHTSTSAETFLAMQAFARRRKIAPYIAAVYKGSGDEAVVFHNGSRILFGARERGFGRGIPGVDVLMCDEAQILTERALDDMLATLNTSELGLALYVGTPPRPENPSESFTRMRTEALSGAATDMVWIECGADPGASPDDRRQWAKANPSYPHRTPAESILRLKKKLTPESFMREAMGVWDAMGLRKKITAEEWGALAVEVPERPPGTPCFFLDAAPGLTSASIGSAIDYMGRPRVELADYRGGAAWLVERAVELRDRYPGAAFAALKTGAIKSLLPELAEQGIEPELFTQQDMGAACGHLQKLVKGSAFTNDGDPAFEVALNGAVPRDIGDDLWTWSRRKSADISPIVAATGALWQLELVPDYDPLDSVPG